MQTSGRQSVPKSRTPKPACITPTALRDWICANWTLQQNLSRTVTTNERSLTALPRRSLKRSDRLRSASGLPVRAMIGLLKACFLKIWRREGDSNP